MAGIEDVIDRDHAIKLLSGVAVLDRVAADLLQHVDEWRVEHSRAEQSELVSEIPHIAFWRGFLSPFECAYVLAVARSDMRRAEVRDRRTETHMESGIHVSQTTWWSPDEMDSVLRAIFEKTVKAFGGRVDLAEPMTVARYQVGDRFMAHVDAYRTYSDEEPSEIVRETTSIVYLNDGYEGGSTSFLTPDLQISGRTGDLLHFRNLTPSGEVDRASVHAGLPVTAGEKWVLVQWVRGPASSRV